MKNNYIRPFIDKSFDEILFLINKNNLTDCRIYYIFCFCAKTLTMATVKEISSKYNKKTIHKQILNMTVKEIDIAEKVIKKYKTL